MRQQERVLRLIKAVRDWGYPPTRREMTVGGLVADSFWCARQHVIAQIWKGDLVVHRHVSRGIRLAS